MKRYSIVCFAISMIGLAFPHKFDQGDLVNSLLDTPFQNEDPLAEAEQLFDEGWELFIAGNSAEALAKFEAALPLFREAEYALGEAFSLLYIGVTKNDVGDYLGALNAYEESLPIWKLEENLEYEIVTLNNIGEIYRLFGQFDLAITYFQDAIGVVRKINDPFKEGTLLSNLGKLYADRGHYPEALDAFEQALNIRRAYGDQAGESKVLNNIATVYLDTGEYTQAIELLDRALEFVSFIGDEEGIAVILGNLGSAYAGKGEYELALNAFQQAFAFWEARNDDFAMATTLNSWGKLLQDLGQFEQALTFHNQALEISQAIGDQVGVGDSLNSIGVAYDSLGQYELALDSFNQALLIHELLDSRVQRGTTLNNIGAVYIDLGQYEQALDKFDEALRLARDAEMYRGESYTLNNIGLVYDNLAQYELALDFYQQSFSIFRKIDNRKGAGDILLNIGTLYAEIGQYDTALSNLQEALLLQQEVGNQLAVGVALNNMGGVYSNKGQYEQAFDILLEALTIRREVGDLLGEVTTINNIGYVYYLQQDYESALEQYEQSLELAQAIDDKNSQSTSYYNMGLVYQGKGDIDEAITFYKDAINLSETIQEDINIYGLKASFAGLQSDIYTPLILLLWEQNRFEEAFDFTERSRARAFLDQLANGTIQFRDGLSEELLIEERDLRQRITAKREQLILLHHNAEQNAAAIPRVEAELKELESKYTELLFRMKRLSPATASLVTVDIASVPVIQASLDEEMTLIEYFVTEGRTLAFIISRDNFMTVSLPEATADNLTTVITNLHQWLNIENPYPKPLRDLYVWLVAPLTEYLDTPLVGIIPHQSLHYVPFASLTDGESYFGHQHALFVLPSANSFGVIQENVSNLTSATQPALIFGNPATVGSDLPPLPYAATEAMAVADLFATSAYTITAASESRFWSVVEGSQVVHLAAHGSYNVANPLFSAIQLAPSSYEETYTSGGKEDGRLEVHEVYGLDLRAAKLVVLSACQTNIGEVTQANRVISAGDEIVGLTRAFFFAGTPTVISSLWNVDDAATEQLMVAFYQNWQSGMGKAEALQAAQEEVRKTFPSPFYWAGFVLSGDPGQVTEQSLPPPTAEPTVEPTEMIMVTLPATTTPVVTPYARTGEKRPFLHPVWCCHCYFVIAH